LQVLSKTISDAEEFLKKIKTERDDDPY
jgi:hypothetical protein